MLRRIADSAGRFRDLASQRTAGLYVGVSADENPAIQLKAATVSGIAALGVDLEMDLMTVGQSKRPEGCFDCSPGNGARCPRPQLLGFVLLKKHDGQNGESYRRRGDPLLLILRGRDCTGKYGSSRPDKSFEYKDSRVKARISKKLSDHAVANKWWEPIVSHQFCALFGFPQKSRSLASQQIFMISL